jgi:uroporphyrinogen III methyltransferase/synthase
VVTRAREQASDFKTLLEQLGAECLEFPTIEIVPPPSHEPLDAALARLSSYSWVIFTSVNGVRFFMERLRASGRDVRELKGALLAAIGPGTAGALEKFGLRPDLIPGEYRAEGLMEALPKDALEGREILIPRALVARDVLPDSLRAAGALVDVVPAYQTILPDGRSDEMIELFRRGAVDCLTFTSSSTVKNFFDMFKSVPEEELLPLLARAAIACIGPITADAARARGLAVDILAPEYTIPALASAIAAHFAQAGGSGPAEKRE